MSLLHTVLDTSKSNDIFDKYIRAIERMKINGANYGKMLDELDARIHQLDRLLQNLRDNNDSQSKVIADCLNAIASFWFDILNSIEPTHEFIIALVYYIQGISMLALTSLSIKSEEEVISGFAKLITGLKSIEVASYKDAEGVV